MENTEEPLSDSEIIQRVWDNFNIELRRVDGEFIIWNAPNGHSHAKVKEINKFIISLQH